MAEANQVSPNGLPELIIKDAPPVISSPGLKLTRPELYYGENVQDPVFVDTAQPEFDYPSGDRNVETHYQAKAVFRFRRCCCAPPPRSRARTSISCSPAISPRTAA